MGVIINHEVLENQMRALQAAATADSEMSEKLREFIAKEMKSARDNIVKGIKFNNGDPRGAAHSVKRAVYKKILGGNVNIISNKVSGGASSYEAPRKLRVGQRGGNRMPRSQRTDKILHYGPIDRGFILRFVNSGTHPRYAAGSNGKWTKRGGNRTFFRLQNEGDYYRGAISPRNFFGRLGEQAMNRALENLVRMVDQEFNKLFK